MNSDMNTKIKGLFVIGITALSIVSCKKNNLVVDRGSTLTPPSTAKFNVSDTNGTYYIKSSNEAYTIPVGLTTVSDKDRTVNFTYTSSTGATAGVQYNAPASLIIPAGEALQSLVIQGLYSGYPSSSRVDKLQVSITGGDATPNDYKKTVLLTLRKYCDVVLANLSGTYANTYENGSYGPYPTTLTNIVSTGATTATATLSNIYDSGISATIKLDWTDAANFKVSVAPQATQYTYGGNTLYVRSNATGTKTFSSCENTFNIAMQLYTSAVIYDSWQMTMAR